MKECVYRVAVPDGDNVHLFCSCPSVRISWAHNFLTTDHRGKFREPVHCKTCRFAADTVTQAMLPIPAVFIPPKTERGKDSPGSLEPCAESHLRNARLSLESVVLQMKEAHKKAKRKELKEKIQGMIDRFEATGEVDWESKELSRMLFREAEVGGDSLG